MLLDHIGVTRRATHLGPMSWHSLPACLSALRTVFVVRLKTEQYCHADCKGSASDDDCECAAVFQWTSPLVSVSRCGRHVRKGNGTLEQMEAELST
jgi:hypothetical protein